MSPPSLRRTVTLTPARSSSALNSASRSGVLGSKERSSTWLSGIRFTCAPTRRACAANSCAWRGVSFTPFPFLNLRAGYRIRELDYDGGSEEADGYLLAGAIHF